MFNFLQLQYKMGKISEQQLRDFSPKFITENEVNKIIGGTNK